MELFRYFFNTIEILAFVYIGFAAVYIFLFAFASLFRYAPPNPSSSKQRKFAVLIPGYKEDIVITDVAKKSLDQNYPKEAFDVIVIADSFKAETLAGLGELDIRVVEVSFEKSTKSKALNVAMDTIGDDYDVALILDADNIMAGDFITRINQAFDRNYQIVQGHRVAKNLNSNLAVLDAVSEEINNSIFRKGHRILGLSSALIGSGMAFDYAFFKKTMKEISAVGGFDKELELSLLRDGYRIEYVADAIVMDEKVQKSEVFTNQRKRWLSAQFIYFRRFAWSGLKELFRSGNIDFADKVYQMIQPPRILLLGILSIITFAMALINLFAPFWMLTHLVFDFSSWLVILVFVVLAFIFAIPKAYYSKQTVRALVSLPGGFFMMLLSLFKLKGANKKFIHTTHGVDDGKKDE